MSRFGVTVTLLLLSAFLFRLGFTDDMLTYVKPTMRPWLIASCVVLTGLMLRRADADIDEWMDRRTDGGNRPASAEVRREHGGPRLAWLLVLPIAVIFIVSPQPLNSYAAARQGSRSLAPPTASGDPFPGTMIPEADGSYRMSLQEFGLRSAYDEDRELRDKRMHLIGFVAPAPGSDNSFFLTRFVIQCCAADGAPAQVRVVTGDTGNLAPDSWVTVEGQWQEAPLGTTEPPVVVADSIRPVLAPSEPYESPEQY